MRLVSTYQPLAQFPNRRFYLAILPLCPQWWTAFDSGFPVAYCPVSCFSPVFMRVVTLLRLSARVPELLVLCITRSALISGISGEVLVLQLVLLEASG